MWAIRYIYRCCLSEGLDGPKRRVRRTSDAHGDPASPGVASGRHEGEGPEKGGSFTFPFPPVPDRIPSPFFLPVLPLRDGNLHVPMDFLPDPF